VTGSSNASPGAPDSAAYWAGYGMIPRPLLLVLVALAVLLPMATVVLRAAGGLLGAMQDAAGAAVLVRVSQACGILWAIGLVVLLIGLALDALGNGNRPRGES